MYLVEDGVGEVEEVERGDIITDDDDAPNVIRVCDSHNFSIKGWIIIIRFLTESSVHFISLLLSTTIKKFWKGYSKFIKHVKVLN